MGWGYFFHLYNFLNPTLLTSSRKNTWKLFWTHKPSPLRQSLLCHSSPQVISLIYLGNLLEKQTNILSFWCFFRDNRLMSRSDYSPMFPWVYSKKISKLTCKWPTTKFLFSSCNFTEKRISYMCFSRTFAKCSGTFWIVVFLEYFSIADSLFHLKK